MEVRSAIQEIAVEHRRRYGYRRISAELRRQGMLVNHKRVLRIIREDNLLAVQPRGFVVTTDSDHKFEVYLNLAGRMKMTGNGIGSTRCCRGRRAGRNGIASSTPLRHAFVICGPGCEDRQSGRQDSQAAHQRRVHCLSGPVAQQDAVGEGNPHRARQSFRPTRPQR